MESEESFAVSVRKYAPAGATGYRLQFERNGKICRSPRSHVLALYPDVEEPEAPSGLYAIVYFDSSDQPVRGRSVRLQWDNPTRRENRKEHRKQNDLASEASEAVLSMELEKTSYQTKKLHGKSLLVADSINLFRGFQQAMGAQSAQDYKIRNEQMALMAESTKQMMQTQLAFMEMTKNHVESMKAPPAPPQWDKIVQALAPPVAAVCVELVRALRGSRRGRTADSEPSVAELLVPEDARLKRLYELLGKVADADRLEELLKDPKNFQAWVASVKTAMEDQKSDAVQGE